MLFLLQIVYFSIIILYSILYKKKNEKARNKKENAMRKTREMCRNLLSAWLATDTTHNSRRNKNKFRHSATSAV